MPLPKSRVDVDGIVNATRHDISRDIATELMLILKLKSFSPHGLRLNSFANDRNYYVHCESLYTYIYSLATLLDGQERSTFSDFLFSVSKLKRRTDARNNAYLTWNMSSNATEIAALARFMHLE